MPSPGATLNSITVSVNTRTVLTFSATDFPAPIGGWYEFTYPYSVGTPAPDALMLPPTDNSIIKVTAADSTGSCSAFASVQTLDPYAFAVIVGIDEYPQAGGRAKLTYARSDAEAVATHLLNNFSDLAPERTFLLTYPNPPPPATGPLRDVRRAEATSTDILAALSTIREKIDTNGTIVFYYAGHGYVANRLGFLNSHFLLAKDSALNDEGHLVNIADVIRGVAKARAKNSVIILDACFSADLVLGTNGSPTAGVDDIAAKSARGFGGRVDNGMSQFLNGAQDVIVMTASSQSERSYEVKDLAHGIFTYYLLQALKNPPPNVDVTIAEAFKFAETQVPDDLPKHLTGKTQKPYRWAFGPADSRVWLRKP